MNDKLSFLAMIQAGLAEHPEWLREALDALHFGIAAALQKANERAAMYDLAFRSSLSLADPKRLSPESRAILNGSIVRAIGSNGSSECERKALERIKAESGE